MGDLLTKGTAREAEMAETLNKLGRGSRQCHYHCCGASLSLVQEGGKKEDGADGGPDCSVGPRMPWSCQEVFKAKSPSEESLVM